MESTTDANESPEEIFQAYRNIHQVLEADNEKLRQEVEDVEQKLVEKTKENDNLKDTLVNQGLELTSALKQVNNLTSENQHKKDLVQRQANEIGVLKNEIEEQREELKTKNKKIELLRQQVSEINSELVKIRRNMEIKNDKVNELQTQLETLNEEFVKFLRAQTPISKQLPSISGASAENNWQRIQALLRQQFLVSVNTGNKLVAQGRKWMGVLLEQGSSTGVNAMNPPSMEMGLPTTANQSAFAAVSANSNRRPSFVDNGFQVIDNPGASDGTLFDENAGQQDPLEVTRMPNYCNAKKQPTATYQLTQ